jgi:hypothetical protein
VVAAHLDDRATGHPRGLGVQDPSLLLGQPSLDPAGLLPGVVEGPGGHGDLAVLGRVVGRLVGRMRVSLGVERAASIG